MWIFSLLLDVPDPEGALASAVTARVIPPPPEPDREYDRAIDAEHGMVEIEGQSYYTSEILYSVDYAVYAEVGARLSARETLDDEV